jgi:hypothetical protein
MRIGQDIASQVALFQQSAPTATPPGAKQYAPQADASTGSSALMAPPDLRQMPVPDVAKGLFPNQDTTTKHSMQEAIGALTELLQGPARLLQSDKALSEARDTPAPDQLLTLPPELAGLSKNGAGTINAAEATAVRNQMFEAVNRFSEQAGPALDRVGRSSVAVPIEALPSAGNAADSPALLQFLAGRLVRDPDGLDRLRAMPESTKAKFAQVLLEMLRSKPEQGGSGSLFGRQPIGAPESAPKADPVPMADAGGGSKMPAEYIRAYDEALPKMRAANPDFRPHHEVFAEKQAQAKSYVGMTKEDALNKARSEGKTVDIVRENGRADPRARLAVYLPDNLNLTIEQGRVSEARSG